MSFFKQNDMRAATVLRALLSEDHVATPRLPARVAEPLIVPDQKDVRCSRNMPTIDTVAKIGRHEKITVHPVL